MNEQDRWEIGKRYVFKAKYINSNENAILFRQIVSDGYLFRDHLWIPSTKKFEKLKLNENDEIIFSGKVNNYYKGHEPEKLFGYYIYKHDQVLVPDITIKNIYIMDVIRYIPPDIPDIPETPDIPDISELSEIQIEKQEIDIDDNNDK